MKKETVGIITFHHAHNYGAMLQAYALQKIVKDRDFDVKFINYINSQIARQYKKIYIDKRNMKTIIKSSISAILFYFKKSQRYNNFQNFMYTHLSLTSEYRNLEHLKKDYPRFDYYITGSDQVWNTDIMKTLEDSYTLNFGANNTKRISYAASIGNSFIEEKFLPLYKEKINTIDCISVRETQAKILLKPLVSKKIEVTIDPALLLEYTDWNKLIPNIFLEKEKYILVYVLEKNPEAKKVIEFLSKKTGLKIIHFEKQNKYSNVLRSAYTSGPEEFLSLIKNAEYVISGSFHATVFSIIFHKKFYIIPHSKTGSRVTDLLSKLNLNRQIVYSLEEFKKIDYDREINYNEVDNRLNKERKKSLEFLEKSLKK